MADEYDRTRGGGSLWRAEQAVADRFLRPLERGTDILDVPVGTGRLLEIYKRYRLDVHAVDVSDDMLKEARKKAARLQVRASFQRASVFALPYRDNCFDSAICYRLLTLLGTTDAQAAIAEMARVSRRAVLATAHISLPAATVVSSRSLGWALRLPLTRRRYHRKGYIHPRDFWLQCFSRSGLEPSEEVVLREQPGLRRTVAWVLHV